MARRRYKNHYWRIAGWLALAVIIIALVNYFRPLPAPVAQNLYPAQVSGQAVNLPWPAYGQAAISASGYGLLAKNGSTKPAPTASVAKVITALAVLSKKPLAADAAGPTITLTQADVDSYNQYANQDGSVVPVQVGEQISQRQALEAMLLPSADNLADSLAIWAFGSIDAYTAYANSYVKSLGLNQTHVADASGFSPQTTSTATDLVQLGTKALANPVVAAIVAERSANLPVAGVVYNVNWLLNSDGFFGIKTGNTDQAGGCFLFADKRTVAGQSLTIIGAVMGAPNLYTSMLDSRTLADASPSGFAQKTFVPAGQPVVIYKNKWKANVLAVTQDKLSGLVWLGQPVKYALSAKPPAVGAPAGTKIGTLTVTSGNKVYRTDVVTDFANQKPSIFWRLTR